MQMSFGLRDPAMEDALNDVALYRELTMSLSRQVGEWVNFLFYD